MNLETQLKEGERALAHIWKATALRGALAIAFSVVILIWPSIGLTALIALFGAFALVSGVATIGGAFSLPTGRSAGMARHRGPARNRGRRRRLRLARPLGAGLLYAIAAWAIAIGIFEIALSFALPISGGGRCCSG